MKKGKIIVYWVATLWLSLGMVSTGIVQIMRIKAGAGGADSLAHLGYPAYLLTVLGVAKILGVAAVLAPRLPLIKEWAYAGFCYMMSAAVTSHLVCGDGAKEIFGAALLLVLAIMSCALRPNGRRLVLGNR